MELYKAGTTNKLLELKALVNKNYSLMEECSKAGFYWTVLHYAANYGFVEMVEYILRYYRDNPNMIDICNLQSNLGMSPLFLAMKNCTDQGKKKKILKLYVQYDAIDFGVVTEEGVNIISLCKEYKMLDYLAAHYNED